MKAPRGNVVRLAPKAAPIPPQYLAMAMAQMHAEGRLFQPKAEGPTQPEAPANAPA